MANRIRVLQTIRQGNIGGGESHVLNLVSFLNQELFEPIVLSFTSGPMVDKLRSWGIRTYVIQGKSPLSFSMWRQIEALLKKERIDLIHVHGTRAGMNILWAARQLRIPIIYTVHGWSFHSGQSSLVRATRIAAEWLLTHMAAQTITVSDANHVTGQQAIPGFDSKVVLNGIDMKRFRPNQSLTDIRPSYGIPAHHTLLVYLARMTQQKDPLTMIEAFDRVARKYQDVTLLMIGQGELETEVADAITHHKLQKRIIRDNFRLNVPEILNACDVYCLPSLWEGQPVGLIEAMAVGRAVIATHVDGSKELVTNEVDGLLIEPQQPQQLADAIERLHTNELFRQRLAQQAYLTVKDRYDAALMTQQIEALYTSVLRRKSPTSITYDF